MNAARLFPDPADVAWWLRELRNHQGCLRPVPNRTEPLTVAAYAEALRQLYAEANAEAAAEPEPTP